MKIRLVLALALACIAAPSASVGAASASSGPALGDIDENPVVKATEEIKFAIKTIEEQSPRRLDGGFQGGVDGGALCDCSKYAQLEILEAHNDLLGRVPYTFLGLLDKNSEEISESLGGLSYDPEYEYYHMLPSLKYLVNTALEALKCMQCGPCEYNGDDETDPKPLPAADSPPFLSDISHNECCCDVTFIKDLVIKQMRAVLEIVTLNPGAKVFTYEAKYSITKTTEKTILDVSRPYECDNNACPCFTLEDLKLVDSKSEFDICQNINDDYRKIIDFDVVLHEKEYSYAVCVGKNCEKRCAVADTESGFAYDDHYECIEENPYEEDYCYSGYAWLGRQKPVQEHQYYWAPNYLYKSVLNEDQLQACCDIINEFCESKPEHEDHVDEEDIGTQESAPSVNPDEGILDGPL